jgi:hypothetical protein
LSQQRPTPQEHEQTLAAAREKLAQRRKELTEQPSEEAYHQLLDELLETTPPLIYLDRRDEVFSTLREAIGVSRTLDATYPGKGAFRLALLLNHQSTMQNSSGRSEEALASTQEAVSQLPRCEVLGLAPRDHSSVSKLVVQKAPRAILCAAQPGWHPSAALLATSAPSRPLNKAPILLMR